MEEKQNAFKVMQRLTTQSFAIKGFSFTIIALIGNIFSSLGGIPLLLVAGLIVMVFWYLDTYYLRMERIYRYVHDNYDSNKGLDYKKYDVNVSYFKVAKSQTILPLYLSQIIFIIALFLIVSGIL